MKLDKKAKALSLFSIDVALNWIFYSVQLSAKVLSTSTLQFAMLQSWKMIFIRLIHFSNVLQKHKADCF